MNAIETGGNGLVESLNQNEKTQTYSINDVAAWLHMHPGNVRKLATNGLLKGSKVKINGVFVWQFRAEDVDNYKGERAARKNSEG